MGTVRLVRVSKAMVKAQRAAVLLADGGGAAAEQDVGQVLSESAALGTFGLLLARRALRLPGY